MTRKPTPLSELRVGAPRQVEPVAVAPKTTRTRADRELKKKTFEVTPAADREFEILRAETSRTGIELIAEALNLLFAKYNRPQVG